MDKANQKVRQAAKNANLPYWRIADAIGVSEITLCRWLRKALPAETEAQIMDVIQKIRGGEQDE